MRRPITWVTARKKTLGETVRAYREYLPEFFPLPHPSWRNLAWLKRNPWFAKHVIPALRRRVKALMDESHRYNPRPP